MTSKSKTDAVELVKESSMSQEWLTKPEAIALIMGKLGCTRAEAEIVHEQFKRDRPDGWKTVALN